MDFFPIFAVFSVILVFTRFYCTSLDSIRLYWNGACFTGFHLGLMESDTNRLPGYGAIPSLGVVARIETGNFLVVFKQP